VNLHLQAVVVPDGNERDLFVTGDGTRTDSASPHEHPERDPAAVRIRRTSDGRPGRGSWSARRFSACPGSKASPPADLVAFDRDPRDDPGVPGGAFLIVLEGRVMPANDREGSNTS